MIGFVFDVLAFLRLGYIVLCIIVGFFVVVGFFIKAFRKVFNILSPYERYSDVIKDPSYRSEMDDIREKMLSELEFKSGRSERPTNVIQSFGGGKDERKSGKSDSPRGQEK